MDFTRPVQALIPGAQGKILAVLASATEPLSVRTIARLSGVSLAQASRVLPGLVEQGIAERREVPPSSLFRLVPEHVAARAVLDLAGARRAVLDQLAASAGRLAPPPTSVVVFGSFARGTADEASDIDILVVRPVDVTADGEWSQHLDDWRRAARRVTGNGVELLEVGEADAARFVRTRRPLWRDILRDGITILGVPLEEMRRKSA